MRSVISVICCLFLCVASCVAGGIKGVVKDDHGQPLPFATLFVAGTTMGTNTNGQGVYELALPVGTHNVICQYVGFKQQTFSVSISGNDALLAHDFVLKSQYLERNEAVVMANGEDPAYKIIRKAIEQRKPHLAQMKQLQTSVYMKGVIKTRATPKRILGQKIDPNDMGLDTSGKGILYLVEEDASYYNQMGKERYVIHSVKESGDPNGLGVAQFAPIIGFYENNVRVFGSKSRGYISPISDFAFISYNYKYLGQFLEQGQLVNKIQVKPKRNFEPCFEGTIYITDGDYAIHSVDLKLHKKSGLDQMDTLRINQIYIPATGVDKIIKSQVIYFAVNIFGFDLIGSFVNVYNNQQINVPLPDSLFNQNIVSSYDKVANKKDTGYWRENRPIPLEQDEVIDFKRKDSLRLVDENPERIDSLRRKGNKFKLFPMLTRGYSYVGKGKLDVVKVNAMLLGLNKVNMLNFNTTEGFNITPKIMWQHKIDSFSQLNVDVATRYGFSNTHFNGIAGLKYVKYQRDWKTRYNLLGLDAGQYVFQYNEDNPVRPWFNTYSSLLYRDDELKLYERKEVSLFAKRNWGNGFSAWARVSYQDRSPLSSTTEYSFVKGDNSDYKNILTDDMKLQSNLWGQHKALLAKVVLEYKLGVKYVQYPDYKMPIMGSKPTLTAQFTKGISGALGSDVDYDKWSVGIKDESNRLGLLGNIGYHFKMGGFLNKKAIGIADLQQIWGNRGLGYASPYLEGFQFAPFYAQVNSAKMFYQGHIEYHLNGLLTNKVPLFRRLQWYLVGGANAYYVDESFYYHELFMGIDNIGIKSIRGIRVDFVQTMDARTGPSSGIRFAISSFTLQQKSEDLIGRSW